MSIKRLPHGVIVDFSHWVIIDYSRSLEEMISAGKYDLPDPFVVERFSASGQGRKELEIVLFHFDFTIYGIEGLNRVLAEMAKMDYSPVRVEPLLALGESEPKLQLQFQIVALGSMWRDPWDGRHYCPRITRSGEFRSIDARACIEGGWLEDTRFAAVHKEE